ncbi:MAG TPA: hypothetical protein VHA09_09285 [Nitrososphaera sp.]|nr:hypothetical protein [Nitrososphaera sp.]
MYSGKRITFWKTQDGSIYFKGVTIIYLVYLAAMLARHLINVTIVKASASSLSNIFTLSGGAPDGAIATDVLLLLGVGLLFGRGTKALKRYQMIGQGEETLPSEQDT